MVWNNIYFIDYSKIDRNYEKRFENIRNLYWNQFTIVRRPKLGRNEDHTKSKTGLHLY